MCACRPLAAEAVVYWYATAWPVLTAIVRRSLSTACWQACRLECPTEEAAQRPTSMPTSEEHEATLAQIEANSVLQLTRIERKLGLPQGYYTSLRDGGTDWEFAIKLVVVLEAALGAVIAAHAHNPILAEHCARLGLEGRAGKLNLAVDLGILAKTERTAFQALANVRNTFAHHVQNIERTLEKFALSLEEAQRTKLVKEALQVPKEIEEKVQFLWSDPGSVSLTFRKLLWTAGSMLLEGLAAQDFKAEVEAERRKRLESGAIWTLGDMFRTGGFGMPSLTTSELGEANNLGIGGAGTHVRGGLLGD